MGRLESYIAGLVDGEASIGLYVQKRAGMGVGYKVQPQVVIVQYVRTTELEERIVEFCDRHDIKYSIQRREKRVDFKIQDRGSIVNLWDATGDMLVVKRYELSVLATEVIPALDNGMHLNPVGFMKIMDRKERMDTRKSVDSGNKRKYDYDYFREEFEGA